MKIRDLLFALTISNLSVAFAISAPSDSYSDKTKKPGFLQNGLLAQTSSGKKIAEKNGESTAETGAPKAALGFEAPDLGPPPSGTDKGLTAGPFSNIVFGGALDYRFVFPKEMPEGMFMVHVNELFITTNIGDHISVLAEQLLLTSELGTVVGQDHGFVYATFSNLSFLPNGTAIRVGRMRLKYGIDAKLDAPANPLRTMEYRTIGLISDRAIEVAGYFGFVEYTAAVSMGPDFVLKNVTTQDGSVGTIKSPAENRNHPITLRIGTEFSGNEPNVGLSYYRGDNYKVTSQDSFQAGDTMVFGGFLDEHALVSKERGSFDLRWNIAKLKFAAEYTVGGDTDSAGRKRIEAYYFRTDYAILPQKIVAQIQYDSFSDGVSSSARFGAVGLGLTYFLNDSSWVRAFYQGNEKIFAGNSNGGSVAGSQFLLAF